ncbi:MAG: hypothetical protein HY921_06225 [Elusimicrobia bacterium]|nr:hypothetical protein [Elusimicrobiota bacterium]
MKQFVLAVLVAAIPMVASAEGFNLNMPEVSAEAKNEPQKNADGLFAESLAKASRSVEAGFKRPTPRFNIMCEFHGNHGVDSDRSDPAYEIRLLQELYAWVYSRMPPHLQRTAAETTAVINHSRTAFTKIGVGGWSAEDDLDYKYPDKTFYPQGTIKTNYTEWLINALRFGDQWDKEYPGLKKAMLDYHGAVVVHELVHAWQYSREPVRDLASVPGSCPDGLCDEKLINETEKKIKYEREAFEAEKPFKKAMAEAMLIRLYAYDKHLQRYPQHFKKGGPYALLKPKKDFQKRWRQVARDFESGKSDLEDPNVRVSYEGQYIPARNVRALVSVRANTSLPAADFAQACLDARKIKEETDPYFNNPYRSDELREEYPYVKDVEKRYQRELNELKGIFQRGGIFCQL